MNRVARPFGNVDARYSPRSRPLQWLAIKWYFLVGGRTSVGVSRRLQKVRGDFIDSKAENKENSYLDRGLLSPYPLFR